MKVAIILFLIFGLLTLVVGLAMELSKVKEYEFRGGIISWVGTFLFIVSVFLNDCFKLVN